MKFETWWQEIGQRRHAFSAEQWAKAGWVGHEIHSRELFEAEQKVLLDKPNELCDSPDAVSEKEQAA